jgi:SAM-dependent methyltransferase
MTGALQIYGRALLAPGQAALNVRFEDGSSLALPMERFLAPADTGDERLLDRAAGPVLDVGCGPGRHLRALAARGVFALGVDLSPEAVGLAVSGGARAIVADVFGDLPGAGTWRTALLLDGNVGIGGSPVRLLRRLRALLHPRGAVLVEVDAPGLASGARRARFDAGPSSSPWFPWARVSAEAVAGIAAQAGFAGEPPWCAEGRWFARLALAPARGGGS